MSNILDRLWRSCRETVRVLRFMQTGSWAACEPDIQTQMRNAILWNLDDEIAVDSLECNRWDKEDRYSIEIVYRLKDSADPSAQLRYFEISSVTSYYELSVWAETIADYLNSKGGLVVLGIVQSFEDIERIVNKK